MDTVISESAVQIDTKCSITYKEYLKTITIKGEIYEKDDYFCEVKTNNAGWNRESFKGVESDNICKLVDELDTRTNSEYHLYDNFIK